MAKSFLSKSGLTSLWSKLKEKFVAKEAGKGLSTNDYTTEEKQKLAGLSNYTLPQASATTLGGVKVGEGLDVAAGVLSLGEHDHTAADVSGLSQVATSGAYADLTGTPTIPTDNSQLANGAGYQTSEQVEAAITEKGYQTAQQVETAITEKGYQTAQQVETAITGKGYQTASQVESAITGKGYQTASQVQSAISAAGHLKRAIVESLPEVGSADENTVYMMLSDGAEGENIYEEWMVIEGVWERIGSTDVDLSGYLQETDMVEITDEEIDEILAT